MWKSGRFGEATVASEYILIHVADTVSQQGVQFILPFTYSVTQSTIVILKQVFKMAKGAATKNKYSVILPTYNERQNLPVLVQMLYDVFTRE